MKGTGAKRNVCPGSCVSTGAKFPVAPVESAPMNKNKPNDPFQKVHSAINVTVCSIKNYILHALKSSHIVG